MSERPDRLPAGIVAFVSEADTDAARPQCLWAMDEMTGRPSLVWRVPARAARLVRPEVRLTASAEARSS